MARRKRKRRFQTDTGTAVEQVDDKLRAALRSIVRDWRTLREPLPVDLVSENRPGGFQYRIRASESYEELQELVIQFAGRVWQLKDGLIRWLQTRSGLTLEFSDADTGRKVVGSCGKSSEHTIENAAQLCMPLLLCADLYNSHKHYDDCNRSGFQPYLSGVQLQISNAGTIGIYYDGSRRTGDITVANKCCVPFRIEILSRNHPVNLGDAVVVIGRAFAYWLSLIRKVQLLASHSNQDKPILDDLRRMELEISASDPFGPADKVANISELPIQQRLLARDDPGSLLSTLRLIESASTAK
jgi:hypothetical protein